MVTHHPVSRGCLSEGCPTDGWDVQSVDLGLTMSGVFDVCRRMATLMVGGTRLTGVNGQEPVEAARPSRRPTTGIDTCGVQHQDVNNLYNGSAGFARHA